MNRWLIHLLVLIALLTVVGCSREPAGQDQPAPLASEPAAPAAPSSSSPAKEMPPRPEAVDESITPDQILHGMLDVYRKAKLYSDRGVIRTVYLRDDGSLQTIPIPCSLVLRKPNEVRLTVGSGVLTCDGDKLRGQIAGDNQILEKPAPLIFSSIREFYPDISLANAMNLMIPGDSFWAVPQLVLLFAKEPLRTFLPNNVRPKLLEPDWFAPDDPDAPLIPCDRIAIQSQAGVHTYWISRQTGGLLRIEFPIEQIAVPDGAVQVKSLTIDFFDQVISEDVTKKEFDDQFFTLPISDQTKIVDKFLPPELAILGQRAPNLQLISLFDGFSDILTGKPNGKNRILCFWGSDDNSALRQSSRAVLTELQRSYDFYKNQDNLEFCAVNIDPSKKSNSHIRAAYGELDLTIPLFRLPPEGYAASFLSKIGAPSLILIDGKGIVQQYCPRPTPYVQLQNLIERLKMGKDLFPEALHDFELNTEHFTETLNEAEKADVYRTEPVTENKDIRIHPVRDSQLFSIAPKWKADVRDSASPILFDTDDGGRLVVPCEGNLLTTFNASGEVIRKKIPENAAGEPIRFVRTYLTAEGDRFFIASSFLSSHKVHLFDNDFNLLYTLDFTKRQRWVADALITDARNDNRPEVIIALVGDYASNLIPKHGIYAIDLLPGEEGKNFLWADELTVAPFCLAVRHNQPGENAEIIGLNHPISNDEGELIVDSAEDGRRLGEIDPGDLSILWFAADEPGGSGRIGAIVSDRLSKQKSFAVLDSDGTVINQVPLEGASWNDSLAQVIPFDLDRDGQTEWVVPSLEGLVRIFNFNGELIDSFARGTPLYGMGIGLWNGTVHIAMVDQSKIVVSIFRKKLEQ